MKISLKKKFLLACGMPGMECYYQKNYIYTLIFPVVFNPSVLLMASLSINIRDFYIRHTLTDILKIESYKKHLIVPFKNVEEVQQIDLHDTTFAVLQSDIKEDTT